MSLIARLTPTNLQSEKEKFLADPTYNPQFEYEGEVSEEELVKYGLPDLAKVGIAQVIVDQAYHNQTETDLMAMEGEILSNSQVEKLVKSFLSAHQLDQTIGISWSSSYISRASVNANTLKLKSIARYRRLDTFGMIYHELGTHALRRVNYEKQPWYKMKKKFGFENYLPTEEGLASIHSLLPKRNLSAYSTALRYLAVNQSHQSSFSQLWQFLTPYVDEIEKRWMICVRQKRGLQDTSQPGGFTKDLVYFSGMMEVLDWLQKNNYDPTKLYYGKMSCRDVEKAQELNPDYQPQVPIFAKNRDQYQKTIEKIISENHF